MAADPVQGRASEVSAAARLYEDHRARVYSFCLYRLRDRQEAEDAVQTTFLQAFGSLRRGVAPRAEAPWLLTIARNVCVARWRSDRRRKGYEVTGDPAVLERAPAREDTSATARELQDALARLPEQQRRAILMREWKGLSYQEIATELDTSVPAVEALIFRARRGLATTLAGERRRKRGLDLGSLLTGLKTLLGGGGLKLAAATATALTLGGAVAANEVASRHRRPAALRSAAASSSSPVAARVPASVAPAVPARTSRARSRTVHPKRATPTRRAGPSPTAPPQPTSGTPVPATRPAPPDQVAAPTTPTTPTVPAVPSPVAVPAVPAPAVPALPVAVPPVPVPTPAVPATPVVPLPIP